jgi:hypothetical protein
MPKVKTLGHGLLPCVKDLLSNLLGIFLRYLVIIKEKKLKKTGCLLEWAFHF